MKRKRYTEEQNDFDIRSMSQVLESGDRLEDGDHRTDILPLEEEVCRSGRR